MSAAPRSLAEEAARFARGDPGVAEARLAALAAAAIARWQLDEATFWQRVKYRARLIRAARHGGRWPDAIDGTAAMTGERSC